MSPSHASFAWATTQHDVPANPAPGGLRIGMPDAPAALKAALLFALVSLTLIDRFGLRLSASYSIGPTLLALYALVAAMIFTRSARLNGTGALMYVGVATVAGLSFVTNASFDTRQFVSLGSFMLVVVLYAPFALTLDRSVGTPALWRWLMSWYVAFAVFCALAGIVQFYAQFVFHAPWLFDFTPLIPTPIRGSGLYNTTNPVGDLIKSNGFFLREASGFSFYMAFALLCEISFAKRKWVMAVLGLALLLSYSGSGLICLALAMLFPLGRRSLLQVLACVAVGGVVLVLFGDALNVSYTLGRVGEFGSDRSSAYCRFIAPGKLAFEQIDSSPWTALLGHGPGTTQKMHDVCETTYGKLLFEYGLLGAIAFASLIAGAIARSAAPIRLRVALIVQWLFLGGNLLAAESLIVIYFISAMWPAGTATADLATEQPAP